MNKSASAKNIERIVTVFGSSRPREGDRHYTLARELGATLASRGFVVCNGGYGGVMEAASRGAKDVGGRTLAVTAEFFRARTNRWIDEEVRVKTWQERLFELVRRGSGYVACPGGTGTLVELAVVWEMLNKRVMIAKPFAIVGDFWQPIIERVREVETSHAATWGEASSRIIHYAEGPHDAAEYLARMLSANARSHV
ncbi:MAG TPA: LOG family protein [Candidatus Acidoferrales bacterium]|nr:LOG family protein [Candidatus Acidoferrales bacterium]